MNINLILSGCSRKKDKFLNREFHSLTTQYNYLFNGNNLLNQAKEEVDQSVFDNYWQILPIEKIIVKKDKKSLNLAEKGSSLFSQSEEKAVLVIQKHAMNIGGKEKNPKRIITISNPIYFILLFPSLEAFNYILFKYPTSELVNKAKIWREKINIKLNNFLIS